MIFLLVVLFYGYIEFVVNVFGFEVRDEVLVVDVFLVDVFRLMEVVCSVISVVFVIVIVMVLVVVILFVVFLCCIS